MDYCKGTITKPGLFYGWHCGNARPCKHAYHEMRNRELDLNAIADIAYALQAEGPDEYPFGFYWSMARDLHSNGIRAVDPEE